MVARLARFLGLPARLAAAVHLQRRQCGGSAGQMLLALLYAACAGGGHLHAVDALEADHVARRACWRQAVPDSRRLGAYLQRLHQAAREGLRQGARLVSRRLTSLGAQACGPRWGHVPVCGDGPGSRWRTSCASTPRTAATASSSLGEPRCAGVRRVAAREWREDAGKPLDAAGQQRASTGAYQPARWPEEQVYVVIRPAGDGEQRWLGPIRTVIPVSCDRLPLTELVRRHRGQPGQEHACQGPSPDLGLQPPPCRSPAAQQSFYLDTQIAPLRRRLQNQARRHGLRPLIRYCVGSVGRLTCSARRLTLLCSRGNLRWDGLLHAASRTRAGSARPEPRRAQRNGTDAEPAGVPFRPEPGAQWLWCGCSPAQCACGGAQVARRRDEGPAPDSQGFPLKPCAPATPISENDPEI